MEMSHYRHLTKRDRSRIGRMKGWGYSLSEIARKTGFNKSTISRELKRNGSIVDRDVGFIKKLYLDLGLIEEFERIKNRPNNQKFLKYETKRAHNRAKDRIEKSAQRSKISPELKRWVVNKLRVGLTPEQVAGRSKLEFARGLSHESVYKIILADRKRGGDLFRLLPRFKKRKQRLGQRSYSNKNIAGRVGIEKRPVAANQRSRLGDLEGDLIVGKDNKSFLLTIVDRRSRQVAIEFLCSRKKAVVQKAIQAAISRMPVAKTLTLDNGKEFSCHIEVTKNCGVAIYFANPYASHERGTVENTNGLIRRTFPKKTDFRNISRSKIMMLERRLNSTPRKILGYLSSEEFVDKHAL